MDKPPSQESRWWERVDWVGAVAWTLSLGVSSSLIIAMVGLLIAGTIYNRPISEQGAQMLSTILGAAIGAVAVYLGQGKERQLNKERNAAAREE